MPINRQAVEHRANAEDGHAISKDEVVLRLHTGRGDCSGVTLVYIDKYRYIFDFHGHFSDRFHTLPMERFASDARFDTYQARVVHDLLAINYYFRLQGDDETLCFGRQGFFDEAEVGAGQLFTMPLLQEEDVFVVPDWVSEAVVYQIFVDSFAPGEGIDPQERNPDWFSRERHRGHLGGSLQGVLDKLDYLQALGVNTLYLTPVFTSPSNHKYNTSDYYAIDPRFGSKETLEALVQEAHRREMRLLLDVVLHASGVEFFAFRDLLSRGEASAYRDWYHVEEFPLRLENPPNYKSWGYVYGLPKFNLAHPAVREYLLDVLVYWIREADIDGWRLDTADEVSHSFWREARRRVKAVKPEALLVGEVWYDARPWLGGDQLDTVMNYAFHGAVAGFFARGTLTPEGFSQRLAWTRARYKWPAWRALWNLIGSHDTARFLAEAGGDVERLKLAVLFQFTYAGVPYIYYGDEVGMDLNSLAFRAGMYWDPARQGHDLLAFYRSVIRLRRTTPALLRGDFQEILVDNGRGLYGFRRRLGVQEVRIYLNNGEEAQEVPVGGGTIDLLSQQPLPGGSVVLQPRSGAVVEVSGG
jgi:cyclomaltodextrinase